MGVKDLWSVLSPVCEKKSLWELEGNSVAIDLSAWICDSNSICSPQVNMYLRNLFFRTSYMLLLGVKPVFVLEGEAPELKADVIRKRLQIRHGGSKPVKDSDVNRACSRSRLKGLQKQCAELLSYMGIECVKARGEAEALCAHLNATGVVTGVVTQDSDVFLYGATEVYRNFQLAPHYTCDVYRSKVIQEKLGLSRTKLIGYSILAGSDYNEGVEKLGKATIVKFLSSLQDCHVFQKFIEWRNHCYFERVTDKKFMTSDMRLEFSVREKALKDDGFPHLDVIAEYTAEPERSSFLYKWAKPNLAKFVAFAVKKLAWEDEYAAKKFLPILGRWHLLNGGHPCDFQIVCIVGNGQGRNVDKYKVAWDQYEIITAESKDLVAECYPHLASAFEESRQKKKKPKAGPGRGRKKNPEQAPSTTDLPLNQPFIEHNDIQSSLERYINSGTHAPSPEKPLSLASSTPRIVDDVVKITSGQRKKKPKAGMRQESKKNTEQPALTTNLHLLHQSSSQLYGNQPSVDQNLCKRTHALSPEKPCSPAPAPFRTEDDVIEISSSDDEIKIEAMSPLRKRCLLDTPLRPDSLLDLPDVMPLKPLPVETPEVLPNTSELNSSVGSVGEMDLSAVIERLVSRPVSNLALWL